MDQLNDAQDEGRRRRRLPRRSPGTTRTATNAGEGGDLGWIAKGQLDDRLTARDLRRRRSARPPDTVVDARRRRATCSRSLAEETRTPEGRQLEDDQGDRVLRLVRRPRRTRSTITRDPIHRGAAPAGRERPVLDALVAEARLRWGLDPAAGLQVVAAERLVGDADRAVAAAPDRRRVAMLRAVAHAGRRTSRAAARPCTDRAARDPLARPAPALPGRPPGRAGSGRPTARPSAALDADAPRRPALPRPLAPGAGRRRAVGDALDLAPGCASPDGCPWDREQTHQSLRNHLLEEAYEVYDALEAGATPSSPASSATCCCRSCSTPSWRPRRASST